VMVNVLLLYGIFGVAQATTGVGAGIPWELLSIGCSLEALGIIVTVPLVCW